jgi:hypothetical protein
MHNDQRKAREAVSARTHNCIVPPALDASEADTLSEIELHVADTVPMIPCAPRLGLSDHIATVPPPRRGST